MMHYTSGYWNSIHGNSPGEAIQDAEGVQIMEAFCENIAWQLKIRKMTKDTLPAPTNVQKVRPGFIR